MNYLAHPVEPEEVMAYLDAELPAERAAGVAGHLEECAECRALAAGFRQVSRQMAAWAVEPSPARLAARVRAALEVRPREKQRVRWAFALASGLAILLVVFAVSVPNLLRSRQAIPHSEPARKPYPELQIAPPVADSAVTREGKSGPMIVRTASLTVITKEFDNARAAMEDIARRHQGYIARLETAAPAGAGRALSATLRLPTGRLDAALSELRKLGRVEQESQGGEEVTQQYVDLVARLSNARNTEQRLIEVLRQRTGKVADILAVEKEIARVREEIERMDAQRKNMENQVAFATLQLRISEEYKAQMEAAPPSTATRLWNATVEGYRSVVEDALGLALFFLRTGPSLLFWFLILFWPGRFAWRRLRQAVK